MSQLHYDEAAAEQLEAVYLGPDIVAQRARTMALLGLKPGEKVLDIRRQKSLPEEELAAWEAEQRALGESGDYDFLTCRVFFAATKPL